MISNANAAVGGEERSMQLYDRLLASIGARASEIGPRPLASHWPHVGTAYSGLVIAGQALQGWDRAVTGARWEASHAQSPAGRRVIIERSRTWHADYAEPVAPIAELSNRRNKPFWKISAALVRALEPGPEPWYSRYAWANVYPVSTDYSPTENAASPWGALMEAQDDYVGELFLALMEMLDARRIVIVSGPRFWWAPSRGLLGSLRPMPRPLVAAGKFQGRSWVVAYHPKWAFHQHFTTASYTDLILETLGRLEKA
jgi:hypothetical protein